MQYSSDACLPSVSHRGHPFCKWYYESMATCKSCPSQNWPESGRILSIYTSWNFLKAMLVFRTATERLEIYFIIHRYFAVSKTFGSMFLDLFYPEICNLFTQTEEKIIVSWWTASLVMNFGLGTILKKSINHELIMKKPVPGKCIIHSTKSTEKVKFGNSEHVRLPWRIQQPRWGKSTIGF